ncbi:MAG: prepilin-type N-terminal cleavage/methylation domain-containing protein [Erysipelotrichaceae bacterium]|nr:prepilin-type N-terminal cleavage/methylation domain-containing protein [Erysipelotrichaceae bacterium]
MKKGFTLLEMIIVVSVLSILFLLAVPNISKVMKSIEDKGCDALVKVVDTAIIQYKLDFDEYPNSTSDLINSGLLNENQIKCKNNKIINILNGQAYAQ